MKTIREQIKEELKQVRHAIGNHMIEDQNLDSIIDTCLIAFKEEFKKNADFTPNDVEDNGELVDASFYRIYKGQLEKMLL